jgi:HAD superfamily hydrolase (TIGR01509 family)
MGSPIAFIFDMDGVLIDSNPFHKISLRQFCLKYGQDLTEQQLREKIYGRTNKDWIVNVFGLMSHEQLMAYENEKEALFRELYQHDIKPVDGLIAFLDKLDEQQIPRAIGTSAPRVNVDFTLAKTHMEKYFSVILDEDFVTKGKPDPEIYLKVAAALNFKPEHCVVFEDSLSGVQAGKAAGCKVVGITTTHTPEELKDTDLVIENFLDLDPKTLISRLF